MAGRELKPNDIDALHSMFEHEKTMLEEQKELGWSWQDVKVQPATISKLLLAGFVELKYSSNKYKNYMLTNEGKKAAQSININEPKPKEEINVDELFSDVVGYDDLKELLREVILADEPIHVLLYGPPALSKSMFLLDIEKVTGNRALPLLGSSTSHSGMWDLVVQRQPDFILIDEVERMPLTDMAGLLSLMESQRIIRAKVGRMLDETIKAKVIAATNRIYKLPPELLSRFWKYQLTEYGASEYMNVVESVLVNREGIPQDDARKVAQVLVGRTHDVRDAIRISRLSKRTGVDRALQLFLQQKR